MSFSALGLSEAIVRAVTEHGYTQPTPIQTQAIPAVLAGGDLLAGAQTGTGKTAGFVLPILHRLAGSAPQASGRAPIRALILTPTRELAAQVEESVRVYGKHAGLASAVVFGGVGINPQIKQLRDGVDILVATPGRLLDHHQQRTVDLSRVEILVLDEADRMLDMGFIRDIKRILALLPKRRQNLLFSATFSDEIKELADGLLDNPALIEVARRNSTVEVIAQKVHPVDRHRKAELLIHLVKTHQWFQVLVFTRTKHGANRLVEQLLKAGITALAIHGNKSQGARTRALAEFKDGSLDERAFLADIERLIKRPIEKQVVAGFEPDPNARPEPIQLRQPRGDQPRGQPRSQPRASGAAGAAAKGGRSGDVRRGGAAAPKGAGKSPGGGRARPAAGGAFNANRDQPRAEREVDGNRWLPHEEQEVDGNRIQPEPQAPREVDGNRAQPQPRGAQPAKGRPGAGPARSGSGGKGFGGKAALLHRSGGRGR
ncbi:MAG: DEAD/DEAH box helicase [Betaproteobacteria bacterium]|nr:DEAD/DEAH box helicase [Betaproteobacteria bacterium]